MMRKIPAGEYRTTDLWDIYQMVSPKTYRDTSKWQNQLRFWGFCTMFEECKYAFEYMFDGKIHYVGTNDLNYFVVE